jgi:hypothetical protein
MKMKDFLNPKGVFRIKHVREGKVLADFEVPNGIVNEGKNDLLDTYFDAGTQITAWYLGLIDNAGFTAEAATDTHALHPGWNEETSYSEATRPQWSPDPAAAQSITNSVSVDFSINGAAALYGIFVSNINVKGSVVAAVLWSTAAFSSVLNVINGDVLKVTYTVNT